MGRDGVLGVLVFLEEEVFVWGGGRYSFGGVIRYKFSVLFNRYIGEVLGR